MSRAKPTKEGNDPSSKLEANVATGIRPGTCKYQCNLSLVALPAGCFQVALLGNH
jgi:hypothetical protein